MYLSKLRPDGVITFHISNKYLDLEPVIGNVARDTGLTCYAQADRRISRRDARQVSRRTGWPSARTRADLGRVATDARWNPCAERSRRARLDRRLRQRRRRRSSSAGMDCMAEAAARG